MARAITTDTLKGNSNMRSTTKSPYTKKTQRAIAKYGADVCMSAYHEHSHIGNGARTVGLEWGLTTGQADAAINAGREMEEFAECFC